MQESDFQLFISELEYWSLLSYKQLEFLKLFGEKPTGMVPNFDVMQSWRLDGLFQMSKLEIRKDLESTTLLSYRGGVF